MVNLTFCVMIKKILLSLLFNASFTILILLVVASLGLVSEKRTHKQQVSFTDVNGFSDSATFNAFYEDQHTLLKTKDVNILISSYKNASTDWMPILAQVVHDTVNDYMPIQFRFVVEQKTNNRALYSKPVRNLRVNEKPMFIKTGDTPTSILSDATIHTRMYH